MFLTAGNHVETYFEHPQCFLFPEELRASAPETVIGFDQLPSEEQAATRSSWTAARDFKDQGTYDSKTIAQLKAELKARNYPSTLISKKNEMKIRLVG